MLVRYKLSIAGLILGAALSFLPNHYPALASCPSEGLPGMDFLLYQGPLVPCGVKDPCGASQNARIPCTLCHLLKLVDNIFRLLLSMLIIAALVMLTIAGVIYIVSSGNPGMTGMAKKIVIKTLTGFAVFLLSWLIVYTIMVFISVNENWGGFNGIWYEFTCNTNSTFGDDRLLPGSL